MSDDFPEGFAFPLPPQIGEALQRQHDSMHMVAEALEVRIERFLSGLDVDGLLAMRTILCTGDMAKSNSANFFDGQIVAILRYVKGVDPDSGKNPLDTGDARP